MRVLFSATSFLEQWELLDQFSLERERWLVIQDTEISCKCTSWTGKKQAGTYTGSGNLKAALVPEILMVQCPWDSEF